MEKLLIQRSGIRNFYRCYSEIFSHILTHSPPSLPPCRETDERIEWAVAPSSRGAKSVVPACGVDLGQHSFRQGPLFVPSNGGTAGAPPVGDIDGSFSNHLARIRRYVGILHLTICDINVGYSVVYCVHSASISVLRRLSHHSSPRDHSGGCLYSLPETADSRHVSCSASGHLSPYALETDELLDERITVTISSRLRCSTCMHYSRQLWRLSSVIFATTDDICASNKVSWYWLTMWSDRTGEPLYSSVVRAGSSEMAMRRVRKNGRRN